MGAFAEPVDTLKLSCLFQLGKTAYTANRLRPFARRALITLRPFFVAIRFLKPCVRLRGVLCG